MNNTNDLRPGWYEKKLQIINDTHKAGFIHSDARITNPVKIDISPKTLKNLPRLGEPK